jgi:hypothetical protein
MQQKSDSGRPWLLQLTLPGPYPQAPGLSLQKSSKRSAGLSCGGGVSFSGVSGVVSVGVSGVAVPPSVGGGVVSVVGVVSVGGGCGSVSGIVSSGAWGAGSAFDSSSPPHPAAVTARTSSSAPRRAISARPPAADGRSEGSR